MSIAPKCICGASFTYCNGSSKCKRAINVNPPESSFDMSFYMTLKKNAINVKKFKALCKRYKCVLREADGDWQIEAGDPVDFYHLGTAVGLNRELLTAK